MTALTILLCFAAVLIGLALFIFGLAAVMVSKPNLDCEVDARHFVGDGDARK